MINILSDLAMTFNPFTLGSKRYEITEKLIKGDSKDKIVKDLKLKNKNPIYDVNTILNRKQKLADLKSAEKKKKISLDSGAENLDVGSETVKGSELIQRLPVLPRTDDPGGVMVQIEGFAPGQQVYLTAKNILMYQWFKTKFRSDPDIGKLDLSDFINQAIDYFFKSLNWQVKIVKEEVFV